MPPSTENQKLHVLIAANGAKDVSQALALVVRLSKNAKIETKAIVDEEYWPAHRLTQETLTMQNKKFKIPENADEAQKRIEYSQFEHFRGQATKLCEWADVMVLAPIDADTLAKMLHGRTDCLILEILRGWDTSKKIFMVPGMSTIMWENPMTKKQLNKLRKKWTWIKVMKEILWHYDDPGPSKCLIGWDGFAELVDVIQNQAEIMTIGHDVDISTANAMVTQSSLQTKVKLPPELWSTIFEYVGDWEIAKAVGVHTNMATPKEWEPRSRDAQDELMIYMKSLEWTMLTGNSARIINKLKNAPEDMNYLSSLCVKLVIKFCLTDILTYIETHHKDIFWASFGQKLLPTKASAVYGRVKILEWWRTSPTFMSKDYSSEAMDGASKSGFVEVLDWWRKSGLPLKFTELALEQASSKGHISVLEWWKENSTHQGTAELAALLLKPGKSLLAAAQNNQSNVLRWWAASSIPLTHDESVCKFASAHGHVDVLNTWRELQGGKMGYDYKVLIEPTKNGHVGVLEWWKDHARSGAGKVEYKTCDVEEALEDSVGSERRTYEVKKWWAKNGLNLGVQVSEWTRTKML